MAKNYLTLTEPLTALLTSRTTTLATRLDQSRKCMKLAEAALHEKSRYAYLILAEQVLTGSWDEKPVPKLSDFGYADGMYTGNCRKCRSDFLSEKRAHTCRICAEKALAQTILGAEYA